MSSQESSSGKKYIGVVKWFNDAKGFGFIEHESGKDVFVHYSVIEWEGFKTLKDGEQVEYELKEGEKGLHAARVARPNVAPEDSSAEDSAAEDSAAEDSAAEDSLDEQGANDDVIAPSLENGEVETRVQSLSESIEVSNDPKVNKPVSDDPEVPSDLAEEIAESIS